MLSCPCLEVEGPRQSETHRRPLLHGRPWLSFPVAEISVDSRLCTACALLQGRGGG